MLTRSKTRKPS